MFREAASFAVASLLLAGCEQPEALSRRPAYVIKLPDYDHAADRQCGGTHSPISVRDCARLGSLARYTGLYLRTFEGSSFKVGTQPGTAFDENNTEGFVLELDDSTDGHALLPDLRFSHAFPVDPNYIEFDGRRVLDRSSNPAVFGSEPLLVVDRIVEVRRVSDKDVIRRARDGSVLAGYRH